MSRARASERGAALLIALGALALIAALAAAALSLAAGPATRAAAAVEQAKATRAAEAAVHRLTAALAREDLRRAAPLDGTVVSTSFFGAAIDFAAQDVGGLVDLNAADEAVLKRLLEAMDAPEATEIAALWLDARAATRGRSGFRTSDAALDALPERLREQTRPALAHATTLSGRAAVDPWVATAPALAAAADVPLAAARRFVAARALEGRRAPLPPQADLAGLAVSDAAVIRLTVRTTTPGGGRAAVSATIRLSRSPRAPATFLAWR